MIRLSDEEYKKRLLGILNYIDSVCRSIGVNYSLAYGTLLGSIRHKGFIPWDDDIDIMMERKDYLVFEQFLLKNKNQKYNLFSLNCLKKYDCPLAKMVDTETYLIQKWQKETVKLGAFVDIFVFDRVPMEPRKRNRFFKKTENLQRLWYIANLKTIKDYKVNILIKMLLIPVRIIGPRFFAKKLNKLSTKYLENNNYPLSNVSFSIYGREKETFDSSFFEKMSSVVFENRPFLAIETFDHFLKKVYKNYWELPPVEKRKYHHDFEIYSFK